MCVMPGRGTLEWGTQGTRREGLQSHGSLRPRIKGAVEAQEENVGWGDCRKPCLLAWREGKDLGRSNAASSTSWNSL